MTNALTHNPNGNGAVSVYDRMDNPMQAVEQLGNYIYQSGMFGCVKPQQGQILAMTCMVERINPLEFVRKYHIIQGRLSMRADAMLAEFKRHGGKCRWLKTGDDGQAAEAEFTIDGQTLKIAYTLDDAKRAGLVKADSAWTKFPGEMLRARLISKAVRMLAPEVVAGTYTPEEIEDSVASQPAASLAQRQAELQADLESQSTTTATATASQPQVEEPPFDVETTPTVDVTVQGVTREQLVEIIGLWKQLGELDGKVVAKKLCEGWGVTDPSEATYEQAATHLAKLKAKLASASSGN